MCITTFFDKWFLVNRFIGGRFSRSFVSLLSISSKKKTNTDHFLVSIRVVIGQGLSEAYVRFATTLYSQVMSHTITDAQFDARTLM